MPLTCILTTPRGATRLDATQLAAKEWARIHRVRPRPILACPECGSRIHAKESHLGFRFFAHDHAQRDCALSGETREHLRLKGVVATLVRATQGWTAAVEAAPRDGDNGGWRADVLATGPQGRRIAFEVQLAPMTAADGAERGATYERDGVEHLWLTPRKTPWRLTIPTLVLEPAAPLAEVEADQLRVILGLYRVGRDGTLAPRGGNPPLPEIVEGLLRGDYRTHTVRKANRDSVVIASVADIERSTRTEAKSSHAPEPLRLYAPAQPSLGGNKDENALIYHFYAFASELYGRLFRAARASGRVAQHELGVASELIQEMRGELDTYERAIQSGSHPLPPGIDHHHVLQLGRAQLKYAREQFDIADAQIRGSVGRR